MGGRRIGAFLVSLALVVGVVSTDAGISSAQGAGSNLLHEVTPSDPAEGGQIRLQDTSAFNASGGVAVFEPGTAAEERFTYTATDGTNQLIGISRPDPVAHASGSFVEAVSPSEPTPTPSPTPSSEATPTGDPSTAPEGTSSTISSDPTGTEEVAGTTAQTSTAEVGSDPCDILLGQSCVGRVAQFLCLTISVCDLGVVDPGPAVQQILDIIDTNCPNLDCTGPVMEEIDSFIYENCGYGGLLSCEQMIEDRIAEVCDPSGYQTCDQVLLELIGNFDPDELCDLNDSGRTCYQLVMDVVGGIDPDAICDPSGYRTCLQVVLELIEGIDPDAICDPSGARTCLQVLLEIIGNIDPDELCDLNDSGRTCYQLVMDVVGGIDPDAICDPNGYRTCQQVLLEILDSIDPDELCDVNESGRTCYQLVMDVVGGIDPDAICDPNGYRTCQQVVLEELGAILGDVDGVIATVITTACGSQDATICANNLIASAVDLVAAVCGTVPGETGTSTDVQVCIDKLGFAVDSALTTVCGSTDPSACANNLTIKITALISAACGSVPTGSSSSSGAQICVDKVVKTVNETLVTACGSTNPSTCVDGLITKITGLVTSACGAVPVGSNSSNGAQICVDKVVATVDSVLATACGSSDPAACAANLITKINGLIVTVCGAVPVGTSSSTGSQACVDKVVKTVYSVLVTACGSNDAATCAANLIAKAQGLIVTACGAVPVGTTSSTGAQACVDKVVATVDSVLITACGFSDPAACAANLITKINGLVVTACGAVPVGTSSSTGAQACVDKVVRTVNSVQVTACGSTEAATCAGNLIDRAAQLLVQTCSSVPLSGTEPATWPEVPLTHPCVALVLEIVTYTLEAACGGTDAATCLAAIEQAVAEAAEQIPPLPEPPQPPTYGDPYRGDQWALDLISASGAYTYGRAAGVLTAVIGSGVDLQHDDLNCPGKLKVVLGSDLAGDGSGPDDLSGAGTHSAGIIGACTDNGVGVAGVAPDSVVLPFQLSRSESDLIWPQVASALRRATDAGARVIDLLPTDAAPAQVADVAALRDALQYAASAGVVVVAAAAGPSAPLCTATELASLVVCVAPTDRADRPTTASAFPITADATRPALAAPGGGEVGTCNIHAVGVLSLAPLNTDACAEGRDGYSDASGEGPASAHVSGTAALVYGRVGARSPAGRQQVINILVDSASDLGVPGYDPVFGSGRVNAAQAMQLSAATTCTGCSQP